MRTCEIHSWSEQYQQCMYHAAGDPTPSSTRTILWAIFWTFIFELYQKNIKIYRISLELKGLIGIFWRESTDPLRGSLKFMNFGSFLFGHKFATSGSGGERSSQFLLAKKCFWDIAEVLPITIWTFTVVKCREREREDKPEAEPARSLGEPRR